MQTYQRRHHTFIYIWQCKVAFRLIHAFVSLSSTVLVSFLISALLGILTVLVPLFEICKNALLFCATHSSPSGEAKLAGFSREKTEQQIPLHCSTAVQSSEQQLCRLLACQNTSLPCKFLCFVFFCHSRSSQASSLSKKQFGRRKKVFSLHLKKSAFETV